MPPRTLSHGHRNGRATLARRQLLTRSGFPRRTAAGCATIVVACAWVAVSPRAVLAVLAAAPPPATTQAAATTPADPAAQAPAGTDERPVFGTGTDMVVLHVSVKDGDRRPVEDLPCDAFTVYENDAAQEVRLCEQGDEPLTLGLAIDSSTSMMPNRELVARAASEFVRQSHPATQSFVLLFNEHVRRALPGDGFTSDPVLIAQHLARLPARGRTALYDAIDAAVRLAQASGRLKKAIVLVSDGGDNASRRTFDEALERAMRANVTIFAVSISDGSDRHARPGDLRRLAAETGGLVFTPRRGAGVERAFERIRLDLQGGYTLAYSPASSPRPGEYRRVRVTVTAPGARRLHVRTRSGYLAEGSTHASATR